MDFLEALTRLKPNRRGGRFSPHKPAMMLAVLDLALAGRLPENRIELGPPLLERYRAFWEAVAEEGDRLNPFLPFFHLRSEPFWQVHAIPGKQATLDALTTVSGMAQARSLIDCASLDDSIWKALQSPEYVEQAAQVVISHWFPDKREALEAVWARNREVSRYERVLNEQKSEVADGTGEYLPARNAAFRRLVLEAYDYRCAASGWRFVLDDWALVEAAHIVPFQESRNDNPRNGLALSPTFHRLMDKGVIAPGPDMRWHLSPVVDHRFPDNRPLVEIEGSALILPRDNRRHPSPEALEWRLAQLRQAGA